MSGLLFIQPAKTVQDGVRYRWVADPDSRIVYVDHELTGEDFADAVAEGTRALVDDEYAAAHLPRPHLRVV